MEEKLISKVVEEIEKSQENKRLNITRTLNTLQGGRCIICKEKMVDKGNQGFIGKKITKKLGIACINCFNSKRVDRFGSHEIKEELQKHISDYGRFSNAEEKKW